VFPVHSNGMRRKYTGSRRFLPYIFVLGSQLLLHSINILQQRILIDNK
jgi:hypothetical protein